MMGTKLRNFAPLPDLSLEGLVPRDNFYRRLQEDLDLSFVRELVKERYASSGRPSVDPEVFFKLELILFFEGLRSERQLMAIAADRLSIRWYLGYDLHEPLPDHSTLTRIRERYGVEIFQRFFERIVELCIEAGIVWGKELYFDATKVEADASVDSVRPRLTVEDHLSELFSEELEEPEPPENPPEEELPQNVTPLRDDPSGRGGAETDVKRHDWLSTNGRQQREVTRGNYQRQADSKVSTTDPDASMMQRAGRSTHPGYHLHYVVDGGKARVILQVLVTPSEVMENQPMLDLLWRSCFRWHIRPQQVTGDTTYGTVENIKAIEDGGIRAYLPLPDFGKRTPFFGKNEFIYDAQRDVYVCPQDKDLRRYTLVNRDKVVKYKADPAACNACLVKSDCTKSSNGRLVSRSFDEDYLDMVRTYHLSEPYKKAIRKRQVWVEPMFAEAKCWHGLRRFRLRRLARVNIEALFTAAGQNLKRLLTFGNRGPKAQVQAAALRPAGTVDPKTYYVRNHRVDSSWWLARAFLNTPKSYQKSSRSGLCVVKYLSRRSPGRLRSKSR
jgi:transposase